MLYEGNGHRILSLFFDSPLKRFQMREISRKAELAPKSVLNYLKKLTGDGLVRRVEAEPYPYYKANFGSEEFRFQKTLYNLSLLHESGLTGLLWEELQPKALVLFGSFARGENTEKSDVDIFVNGMEAEVDLSGFEKLGKVSLFFEKEFSSLSRELKNSIANGVVLKGRLEAFG